ncbi:MAG: cbb3-type cytochrome c oxidase subunit I, partial [Adhaeribacter sp.]
MKYTRLWLGFIVVMVGSFAVLGYYGSEIYRKAPPIPEKVVTASGQVLFTGQDIKDGQNVWQSMGGQEVGSIWGHGAYQAPDWTAEWLHKEAVHLLDTWAQAEQGKPFGALDAESQARLQARLKGQIRQNTYDPASSTITVSDQRAAAIAAVGRYYAALFMDDASMDPYREAYAIPRNSIKDPERMRQMNAFFFWASWACVTERPGDKITYTNNWPHEKLVGNEPSSDLIIWTGFSVIVLIAGIGLLAWYYASNKEEELDVESLPKKDPLLGLDPTPSMRATLKYFWTVTALILVQVIMGVVTAHYGVEGQALYGFPLSDFLPYSISRTWHVQLAIFWIATSWLATGLFIAPAVSGHEPKFQRAGVNFLFIALLIIVVGSLAGQWFGVM